MQIENDYDKDVYNGDIGYVVDVDPDAGELVASFDGRSVTYGFGELDTLIPAYAATKDVGMAQEKAEGNPAGFTETEEEATLDVRPGGIVAFHRGDHDLQEIRLLLNQRVGRMVSVPGKLRKRGGDKDRRELVVEILSKDFAKAIAIAAFASRLDREDIDDRESCPRGNGAGKETREGGFPSLIGRANSVDQYPVLIAEGVGNGTRRRFGLGLSGGTGKEFNGK